MTAGSFRADRPEIRGVFGRSAGRPACGGDAGYGPDLFIGPVIEIGRPYSIDPVEGSPDRYDKDLLIENGFSGLETGDEPYEQSGTDKQRERKRHLGCYK